MEKHVVIDIPARLELLVLPFPHGSTANTYMYMKSLIAFWNGDSINHENEKTLPLLYKKSRS